MHCPYEIDMIAARQARAKLRTPPDPKWVKINNWTPSDGKFKFYGIVNIGSPHETYSIIDAEFVKETNAFLDLQGDRIGDEVQFQYILIFER